MSRGFPVPLPVPARPVRSGARAPAPGPPPRPEGSRRSTTRAHAPVDVRTVSNPCRPARRGPAATPPTVHRAGSLGRVGRAARQRDIPLLFRPASGECRCRPRARTPRTQDQPNPWATPARSADTVRYRRRRSPRLRSAFATMCIPNDAPVCRQRSMLQDQPPSSHSPRHVYHARIARSRAQLPAPTTQSGSSARVRALDGCCRGVRHPVATLTRRSGRFDESSHHPAMLPDHPIPGESETLVGREGTVEQESCRNRTGRFGISLDDSTPETRDQIEGTLQGSPRNTLASMSFGYEATRNPPVRQCGESSLVGSTALDPRQLVRRSELAPRHTDVLLEHESGVRSSRGYSGPLPLTVDAGVIAAFVDTLGMKCHAPATTRKRVAVLYQVCEGGPCTYVERFARPACRHEPTLDHAAVSRTASLLTQRRPRCPATSGSAGNRTPPGGLPDRKPARRVQSGRDGRRRRRRSRVTYEAGCPCRGHPPGFHVGADERRRRGVDTLP